MGKPKPVMEKSKPFKPKPFKFRPKEKLNFKPPSREDVTREREKFLRDGGLIEKLAPQPTPVRDFVSCQSYHTDWNVISE